MWCGAAGSEEPAPDGGLPDRSPPSGTCPVPCASMALLSFTLRTVDVTHPVRDGESMSSPHPTPGVAATSADLTPSGATVWWSCAECGGDVELPAADAIGFLLSCPDCAGPLDELWRWEPAAA
jgi:hypothetical protein